MTTLHARGARVRSARIGKASLALLCLTSVLAGAQTSDSLPNSIDEQQRTAVRALGTVRSLSVDRGGIPNHLDADLGLLRTGSAGITNADAGALLQRLRPLLRADGSETLSAGTVSRNDITGLRHQRLSQSIAGIPVIGGELIAHIDERTNAVTAITAQFLPGAGLPRAPGLDAATAMQRAVAQLPNPKVQQSELPKLAYLRTAQAEGYLVWAVQVSYVDATGRPHLDTLMIDTRNGELIEIHPQVNDALFRQVIDGRNNQVLISEGGSSADVDARAVYDASGYTYSYYSNMFNRDSWDGRGSLMRATVHYGQSYNNAFYQGGSIFFGDGDGVRFAPLGRAIDVVAHEWTHGVTESSAALVYTGESGALNEAMSDIFGAAVEASRMGVTSATWQVGENIFTPATFGDALRYMDTPTLDGASRDYYPELLASDDVHHSSGIGNLAFYLLANGGTHPRGRTSTAVIGIGINEAARVFYSALTAYLQSNDGYSQARNKTALASKVLYGVDSLQFRQVCAAWNAVGAPNDNSVCVTISPIRVRPVVSVLGKTVSWGAVAGATSYRVFSDSVALRTVTGTSTVVGVPLCEIVEVQVSACNVLGCGPLSNSVLVSGPKPPASCR